MANQWFRLYAEFATDPKVQMMSEALQRRYVMLMCMQCGNVIETFHETERDSAIAFHLRITETEWSETKSVFIAKGFINEQCELLNWSKRQFESDSSTARVKAYREKKKQAQRLNETEVKRFSNAPDTDTDTDTDTELIITAGAVTPKKNESGNSQSEKQKTEKPDYPDWFEKLWQNYPPRSGGNDKRKALHAAQARIKSGKDPDYLLQSVFRYSQFVRENGNWGTQYVMQAATFFGPGEHIDNPWRLQHATNQPFSRSSTNGNGLAHDDTSWAQGLFPNSGGSNKPGEHTAVSIEGDFSRVVGGHQG